MNRKLTFPAFALALMVGFSGCDLEVTNPNEPDRARALAGPDDVETLISSAYQQIWGIQHHWRTANFALNHMSSRHAASWGNMGMNDLGRMPREPYPNQSAYGSSYVFEVGWTDSYAAISAASDGLRAIDAGLEIGAGGERNGRATVFAKFSQAMAYCYLGLLYDQAFYVDETTDLGGELETVPYTSMITQALAKFDETIALARATSFTLETGWINGNALTNTQLADLMVTMKARCRANAPRTGAEAATVDWAQVISDSQNGLQELTITGEDASGDHPWWDGMKSLMTENGTWHRMHMDWAGMADVTGQYQAWLQVPMQQRMPVKISTPDLRYPATNDNGVVGARTGFTDDDHPPGLHRYNGTIIFRPERGTYRQSHYGDMRHDAYMSSCSFCYFGDIHEIIPRELRLYEAEAAYRTGNYAETARIVNQTRTAAGLPDAPSNATSDVPGGANCVPRMRYDTQGRCGKLRDALIYEHFEEIYGESGGLEFWHGRRFDILPAGTGLHFPIPAVDLEVLQRSVYTFGGGAGTEAGDPTPPLIVPGSLDNAIERATFTMGQLELKREALQRAKLSQLIVR